MKQRNDLRLGASVLGDSAVWCGPGSSGWIFHRPDNNAFQLGVSCGFVFCESFGFLMRRVMDPGRRYIEEL
jgi:hypothetical protein